ncbi:hypothetical protein Trisim1_007066 [Trichoderma cf. simile WF8]
MLLAPPEQIIKFQFPQKRFSISPSILSPRPQGYMYNYVSSGVDSTASTIEYEYGLRQSVPSNFLHTF